MKIFVAGASGAIGRPLIAELVRQGHTVTGLTRSATGAAALTKLGASVAQVDVFDGAALEQSLRACGAEVVIDELTSLPRHPSQLGEYREADRRLRIEGGGQLLRAALACGVRRYLQQSSGFFLEPGAGLGDESVGLAVQASPGVALAAQTYAELEARLLAANLEAVLLRYGFFYGPGTWYHPEGACAEQARRQEIPIIEEGDGVWSWVHIEDAALATVAALTAPPGIYHLVDDNPSPVSVWLPAFALRVGAPPPPHLSVAEARATLGEDAVYYGTRLRGAANGKAKQLLRFAPRPLDWLSR
jgi:nucleoside-diphosphate-sugar epimerase